LLLAQAAAPERGADGQLALPGRSAREQHARDVGAGDEQHEDHGPEQACSAGRTLPIRPGRRGTASCFQPV
jgi:hypothetical protein